MHVLPHGAFRGSCVVEGMWRRHWRHLLRLLDIVLPSSPKDDNFDSDHEKEGYNITAG